MLRQERGFLRRRNRTYKRTKGGCSRSSQSRGCDLGREDEVTGWQEVYSLIQAADALSGSTLGSGGSEECGWGTVSLKPAARGP